MDNHTEQFKWDDKLVQDYIQFYAASYAASVAYFNSDETLEKFKQSKSKKEEPQWEILEIESYGGEIRKLIDGEYRLYTDGVGFTATYLLQRSDSKIKTVKRLSDGEVFSVGDVIKVHTDIKPIVSFELKNNKQIWCSIDNAKGYGSCLSVSEKAPKEEQVPIKVEIMEFGYGKPQENKGKFYVANFNLPNNAKLPTEKYQSIKSAIEDVLNEDKIKHEKLLSKIESKVRLANMINTQANYLKETLDYINSLK